MYKKEIRMNNEKIPLHVALIMDGNGRWAIKRGLNRSLGHKQGAQRIKEILLLAKDIGIKVVTVFAFSTENWKRSRTEIDYIFELLEKLLDDNLSEFNKKNIRIQTIGSLEKIAKEYPSLHKKILSALEITRDNSDIIFNIAINYGSHDEIITAIKNLYLDISKKRVNIGNINEEIFEEYLMTKGLPKIDLMIRTSGEKRLSNFLLWQLAYSELIFTPVYWPDFDEYEFKKCIYEYQLRDRRYGRVK